MLSRILIREQFQRVHSLVMAVALCFMVPGVSIFAAPADPDSGLRKWTDATGRFEVVAKFVEVSDGKIVLQRKDNEVIRVDHQRLSTSDQLYIAQHLQKALNARFVETASSKRMLDTKAEPTNPRSPLAVEAKFKELAEIKAASEKELYGIRWIESHEEAERIAQLTNKPIMWFRVLGDLEGFM